MVTTDASDVKPSNAIVVDSLNMHTTTRHVETGTNVYPGRLVMKGTNDDDIVVCDGSTEYPEGWAGYEQTAKKYRPATVDTVYSDDDYIAVVWGPGMKIVGRINILGTAIYKGTPLTYAADGTLTPATAGTNFVVAYSGQYNAGTAAADIIVKSVI